MHLKENAHSFGVRLLHTTTIIILITITLLSVGRCEPTAPSLQPADPSLLNDAWTSFVRTNSPPVRPSGSGRAGEAPRVLLRTETFRHTAEPRPEPRMVSPSRGAGLKSRSKRRQTERKRPFAPHGLPDGNCSKAHITHVVPGKFYITGQFGPNFKHLGYYLGPDGLDVLTLQSASVRLTSVSHGPDDSSICSGVQGRGNQARGRGQQPGASDESWQRLEPTVECGEDAMILTVRRKRAIQLVLDQVNRSSLLLFQLPPQCGYFVRATPRDVSLQAQYDACHVTQEDGSYVLPLLWRGVPVKASCPVSHNKPPGEGPSFLCCSSHGLAFKLQEPPAIKEPHINVRGEWTPLSLLAKQCGYTVKKQDAAIIIIIPFNTCGVTMKDGKHTLFLQIGPIIYTLACPIPPLEELPFTRQPLAESPPNLAKRVGKPKLKSLGPLLWIPPFYLAPPNYPHPTYPLLKGHSFYNPPTPLARGVEFISQPKNLEHYYHQSPLKETHKHFRTKRPLSSKDQKKDSGRVYQDKHNRKAPDLNHLENRAATTALRVQVEGPHSQPPGHDFSSYYHYYHLPKIPLPGAPRDPGSSASGRLRSSTNPQNQEFSSKPPKIHQFKGLGKDASDEISSSLITPTPYAFPTSSKVAALYSSYPPQPFPYHFFYLPRFAKGEAKRLGLLHPHLATETNLSLVSSHGKRSMKTDKSDLSNGRRPASVTPAVQPPVPQSYSHKPGPLSVPPPEQPFFPTPGFTYNADPYKYYYHPYYNNYLNYEPEALRGKFNHLVQPTPQTAASPSLQPSNHETPPTDSMNDIQKKILYHYYFYYLPQLFKYNQKLHQDYRKAKKASAKSASQLSPHLDFSETQPSAPASEASLSMHDPLLQSLYSYFITHQQLPSKQSKKHGGKGAKEMLDKEMRDGTAGRFSVFAGPDSVAEASAAPPALSSEDRKGSCMLQKLTSHPDIYILPLGGCGVNKRMMVNLLEVQGVQSPKDSTVSSPGRLMVGCGSSPDSPDEVRFSMKDRQTPAAATVLLRLATDESFGSYYPEAHLPFSLVQNKPVYVELRLLEAPGPGVVLMVHSCLAYTPTPHVSWILFYDGCSSQGTSQLLPSSGSQHIQRIKVTSFPSLPSESLPHRAKGGRSAPEDPQIYFLCLTEVCSAAHDDCRLKCVKGPNSDARATK